MTKYYIFFTFWLIALIVILPMALYVITGGLWFKKYTEFIADKLGGVYEHIAIVPRSIHNHMSRWISSCKRDYCNNLRYKEELLDRKIRVYSNVEAEERGTNCEKRVFGGNRK